MSSAGCNMWWKKNKPPLIFPILKNKNNKKKVSTVGQLAGAGLSDGSSTAVGLTDAEWTTEVNNM